MTKFMRRPTRWLLSPLSWNELDGECSHFAILFVEFDKKNYIFQLFYRTQFNFCEYLLHFLTRTFLKCVLFTILNNPNFLEF